MPSSRLAFALSVCTIPLLYAAQQTESARQDVESYLLNVPKFTAADLASMHQGSVIARAESGPTDDELSVIAAVKIRATRAQTVAYYNQMITYVDGQVTLAFDKFSTPPTLADVQKLTFDREEIEAMKSCRPGDCDIRLGGAGLEALRSSIDWKSPTYADQVHAFLRQKAVDYVAAYQRQGNAALVTYDDRSKAVSMEQQWKGLLASSPKLHHYYPELMAHLVQYPQTPLAGGKDIFYWVKENYGFKPIISIVHGVIYEPPQQPDRVVVVQKQIYASHYYDGSVAVATVASTTESDKPVTYIVYVNRSRGDMLKGGFGGLKRTMARDQAEKAAKQTLGTIKSVLEKSAAAGQ